MLIEWMNWIRSLRTDEILLVLGILLLVDAPRYAYSAVLMAFWDVLRSGWTGRLPGPHSREYTYCPPVSVIIAGHNEADTIARTMESVCSRYPCAQVIVVVPVRHNSTQNHGVKHTLGQAHTHFTTQHILFFE